MNLNKEDIEIREVSSKKDFNRFIEFPYRLYRNHPYYVPHLRFDEKTTLNQKKNPAFAYCDAKYWIALKGHQVVGRIAGIINHAYIRRWNNRYIRFGWLDFEEDEGIVSALIAQVERWGKLQGMEAMHGPMGFTDLDYEGMLVQGFDYLGTLATLYNYAYYPQLLEKLGFIKEVDWVEYRIKVPGQIPEKIEQVARVAMKRYGLSVLRARKPKDLLPYTPQIFQLINQAYAGLHGVVELSERQIAYYTKQYFSFIRVDFVTLVIDGEGKLAAFGITMPSLSKALQKGGGRLFPLGFIHLLRALKKNSVGDMYLVAVRPELQGKGVNAILMTEIARAYIKNNINFAESNPELETNVQVQSIWKYFPSINHKRRRCFIRHIN